MTDLLDGPAKPKKKAKPTASVLAFREYERTSYYLAAQGDFNFELDEKARECFHYHVSFTALPDTSADISAFTKHRLNDAGLKTIPKGDHIDGLDVRTQELLRVTAKPVAKSKKKPKLPLFKSGKPGLAAEVDAAFGSGDSLA